MTGKGFLKALDPRSKLAFALVYSFSILAVDPRNLRAHLPLALLAILYVAASRISLLRLLRRLLYGVPFILAVAVWNPILDRRPIEIAHGIVIRAGIVTAGTMLTKFVLALSVLIVLSETTNPARLAAGLGRLGVPKEITGILFLLERYLGVQREEATRLRQVLDLRGGRLTISTAPLLLARLFVLSADRSVRLSHAMAARGFDGSLPLLNPPRFTGRDAAFLALAAPLLVAAFAATRLL